MLLYHNRWVWGVVFACIMVFLAIQMTNLTEQRLISPLEPGFLLRKAHEMQSRMVEKLGLLQLPDADKSVLATITVNYRKAMTWELRNQFSVTGVSHLLAVSGFHVGIVCAFINATLSLFPRKGVVAHWMKYIVTMLCVWVFTYISGLTTAAVRAAVMLTIYMTGRVLKRDPDKYNTLAGAAFCMLVYNPFYLFDVGFQLSFTAVFFILYLQPRLSGLIEIRNPIIATPWNVLTVTIAAQTGTSFLCFFYFGQSSMVFLFTNLFLSLLATVLIPATLLWMIMPVWLPGMDTLRMVIEMMTRCLMWVVDRFASIPGATLSVRFDFFTLVLSYVCLAFILLYFRLRHYWMLFAALSVLLLILCWHLF
ncbi:MAG: ComEC/Rec2 family competence protein [Tannerella sp.]|jgi:competence protein ComEC|nr:ComEC/Rec2 family competence protein [Tannerella sp.]